MTCTLVYCVSGGRRQKRPDSGAQAVLDVRTDRQWFPFTLLRNQNLKPRVLIPLCPHEWGGRGLLPPSLSRPPYLTCLCSSLFLPYLTASALKAGPCCASAFHPGHHSCTSQAWIQLPWMNKGTQGTWMSLACRSQLNTRL